jgi:hypothetical protein
VLLVALDQDLEAVLLWQQFILMGALVGDGKYLVMAAMAAQ